MGFVFVLMLVGFATGLWLARFNVLAFLIAAAVLMVGSSFYDVVSETPLAHAILAGLAAAFCLPIGYLVGQLSWPSRK
jgi:hypothetical protein